MSLLQPQSPEGSKPTYEQLAIQNAQQAQENALQAQRIEELKGENDEFRDRIETNQGVIMRLGRKVMDLEILTDFDVVTDVHNRSYFERSVRPELEKYLENIHENRRRGYPQSILLGFADLNKLKTINETSYLDGDRALRAVAQGLLSSVRYSDTVGRYGGDEFYILLRLGDEAQDDTDKLEQVIVERALASAKSEFGDDAIGFEFGFVKVEDFKTVEEIIDAASSLMRDQKQR